MYSVCVGMYIVVYVFGPLTTGGGAESEAMAELSLTNSSSLLSSSSIDRIIYRERGERERGGGGV